MANLNARKIIHNIHWRWEIIIQLNLMELFSLLLLFVIVRLGFFVNEREKRKNVEKLSVKKKKANINHH